MFCFLPFILCPASPHTFHHGPLLPFKIFRKAPHPSPPSFLLSSCTHFFPPLNTYWYFHYDLVLFCCSCKALLSLPCQLPSFSPFQIMRKLFFLSPKAVLFLFHKLLSSSYPLLSAPLVAHVLLADLCYSCHLEMLRDHSPVHVLNAGVCLLAFRFSVFQNLC